MKNVSRFESSSHSVGAQGASIVHNSHRYHFRVLYEVVSLYYPLKTSKAMSHSTVEVIFLQSRHAPRSYFVNPLVLKSLYV